MNPPLGVIWANAVVLSSGNLLPFRPFLHHSFYCIYLCKKPNLNYFQTGRNRNTDTVQSREYWIRGKLDINHLRVQFHIQPQLFWTSQLLRFLVGFSKPSYLQKPQCLVCVSSAQGWDGYWLLTKIANSTVALSISEEQNSHKEEQQ